MKVERQKTKPTFEPIVITLETEEEANYLAHLLDNPVSWTYSQYVRGKGIRLNGSLKTRMWRTLHDVFPPTDNY